MVVPDVGWVGLWWLLWLLLWWLVGQLVVVMDFYGCVFSYFNGYLYYFNE